MDSADLARWHADVAAQQARIKAEVAANIRAASFRYKVAACETCLDEGRVRRIRGGVEFEEPCPDEEEDDVFVGWDASAELLDDMRKDDDQ